MIFTHELVPSETVEANSSLVSAFVTAAGGITSHAAIIARAKGIPYVANVDIKHPQNGSKCIDHCRRLARARHHQSPRDKH